MEQRARAGGRPVLFVCAPPAVRGVCSTSVMMSAKRKGGGGRKARAAKQVRRVPPPGSAPKKRPVAAKKMADEKGDEQDIPLPPAVAEEELIASPPADIPVAPSAAEEETFLSFPADVPVAPMEAEQSIQQSVAPPDVIAPPMSPPAAEELPVPDEAVFKLPDRPGGASGSVRRRRRARGAAAGSKPGKPEPMGADEIDAKAPPLRDSEISRLTAAYRTRRDGRDELVDRIERDPDYLFRSGNAEGEYGLAAAIIGTGRPNKQGVYVLPYLQSGHMILLGVILLCAFVYYPGFPLTEGTEEVRDALRKLLVLTFTANAALGVYSFAEAKKRKQPPLFWFFKVALLGNIALQELKGNAPIDGETGSKAKRKRRG